MGKIMINGEQYPSFVVKTGLDDSQIRKDATWSSSKINEELEDVRGELDIIVEEANKNTSINDEIESLTTVWSSKKTSSEIAKHSLPIIFDSGIVGNTAVEIYKLSNVTYEATGGEHPYNLNLLLSTRAGEEVELFGGKNDAGWKLFARKNNDYASKIMDIYLDGYDVYVRLATYYNFFKVYHKNGALRSDFAVTKVTSIPDTATEIPITAPGVMDDQTSTESTWSSSKIAQQDGIKQVFYASAISYPSIFWVLSDATTGVFWFKHTLSSSAGIQSVEGYADLTHNTVRVISGNDINVAIGTDATSGKKGVRFTVSWGDNATTSCKITEARPVTAIPTQIVSR